MGYSIFASKKVDGVKTSKELQRFDIEREEDGLFQAASIELYRQGYRVHAVIGREDFDESGRPSRKRTPRQ
jgi:hypothetical protein